MFLNCGQGPFGGNKSTLRVHLEEAVTTLEVNEGEEDVREVTEEAVDGKNGSASEDETVLFFRCHASRACF